jgi:hypothetical protein
MAKGIDPEFKLQKHKKQKKRVVYSQFKIRLKAGQPVAHTTTWETEIRKISV